MNLRKKSLSEELEALKKQVLSGISDTQGNNEASENENHKSLVSEGIPGELPEAVSDGVPAQKESFLVTYSLSNKNRSKKMLFNYELIGRNGKEGFLQILNGEKVTSGCVIIPADKGEALEDFLKRHEVEYATRRITLA